MNAAVITVSDSRFTGEHADTSGPMLVRMLEANNYRVFYHKLVPDEEKQIRRALIKAADELKIDLVVTTGGTGLSMRDVTPEATIAVCERMVPGIAEAMRYASLQITPRAMLSRAVCGIRGQTLIINLPGSEKAAAENLSAVLPALWHGLEILKGTAQNCGDQK